MAIDTAPKRTIYSVSDLNSTVAELLKQSFSLLWIEGEISNLVRPRSGHYYFSLKDDKAQVRCALFRAQASRLKAPPKEGDQILVRARVGLYQPRGSYQLIVDHIEPAGLGELQRAYEALKKKLSNEGLFNAELKKPIPKVPHRIGVISSPTGAAFHDVLSVLSRRFPMGDVLLYPSLVQGDKAPQQLIKALKTAQLRNDCEVLLIVRGGGSIEDLWAFNDEALAREVASCSIPIISGVGHEIDTTIVDFAADLRSPTPSAAAEVVCPNFEVYEQQITLISNRLSSLIKSHITGRTHQLEQLQKRLLRQHPQRQIEDSYQWLDETIQSLEKAFRPHLTNKKQNIQRLKERLGREIQQQIDQKQRSSAHLATRLHNMSPLNTLSRGYAIAHDKQGLVIKDSQQVHQGDEIRVKVHAGELECQVQDIKV